MMFVSNCVECFQRTAKAEHHLRMVTHDLAQSD